jgi:hypothetical protein
VGAIVLFDITEPKSLMGVKFWKQDIDQKVRIADANESPIPVVLVGNKVNI